MYERLERNAKQVYDTAVRYQHRLGFISFALGFLFDIVTLHRIDRLYEQLSFSVYMCVGTILLVWISLRERKGDSVARVAFTALQFIFGALAGGFIVLYGRSGTLAGSTFFLSGLTLLLVGNELLRERYRRVLFRFSIWFVLLIAYTTLLLPLAYGRLGFDVFTHGLITAAICGVALLIFFRATRVFTRARDLYAGFAGMTLTLSLFLVSYYTHSIPPVPLSLQSAFIAHDVASEQSDAEKLFHVTYEPSSWAWLARAIPVGTEASSTFLVSPSTDVTRMYCWSAIYAPAKMTSILQHRWEIYDTVAQSWRFIAIVSVPIAGGRPEGWRAYSSILMSPGDERRGYGTYRCNIETEEGALLGRRTFTAAPGVPSLITTTY